MQEVKGKKKGQEEKGNKKGARRKGQQKRGKRSERITLGVGPTLTP